MSLTSGTSQSKGTTTEKGTGGSGRSKAEPSKRQKSLTAFQKEQCIWRAFIKKHREDIRDARPVVDDKPPKLNVCLLYDPETLKNNQRSIFYDFALNPELIKLLYYINVWGGRTDTFKFDHGRVLPPSNFMTRRCEALAIEKMNKVIKEMIETTQSRMPRVEEYAKLWREAEELIEFNSQFPLFWKVKKKKKETIEVGPSRTYFKQYVTEKSAKYPDKRPRVFFEISIKSVGAIGKLVAVLFSDYVPMTVKNFLAFCNPKAHLTYRGCLFYLIFQNFFCQTGDVVENKGFGGTSIYGPYFGDEDHTLQHGERGILTMFNLIPNRNQCQFLITFRELKTLNGTNVVFGKIIRGFHVLDAIESVGSKKTGRPKVEIYISDCDEI